VNVGLNIVITQTGGDVFPKTVSGLTDVGRASTQTTQLLGGLAKAAAGLFTIRAAMDLVSSSLRAISAQEASINSLNLALANQGRLTAATSAGLQAYASSIQATTTVSDDAALSAMAMLTSFSMNEAQIRQTMAAALDFSSATRTDLQTSVEMLGKAYTGNTMALQRLGFQFTEGATKTQLLDSAVSQIERRFGCPAVGILHHDAEHAVTIVVHDRRQNDFVFATRTVIRHSAADCFVATTVAAKPFENS
jgi:hypothetical protein